jgi:predicted DNA-binding transcriptional regulator AlpA
MPEQLLTPTEVSKKLRISRSKFYRIRAKLIANGLQKVKIDGSTKYLESSIDRMIIRAAETETDLCG